jgi:hypothetical protein
LKAEENFSGASHWRGTANLIMVGEERIAEGLLELLEHIDTALWYVDSEPTIKIKNLENLLK